VIVAFVVDATPVVETVKVAVDAPARTVTLAGTVATVKLEPRVITKPPAGATALIVTVPVEEFPPRTEVGESESPETAKEVIVSEAVTVAPVPVAEIVAVTLEVTEVVLTVKVAVFEPAGTVTVAGTVALELLEASVSVTPPVGAVLPMVTVAVDVPPPETVVGERVNPVGWRARTVLTSPDTIGAPQPDAESQPVVAFDVEPFGSAPLLPIVMSKKTAELPLKE